MSYVFLMIWLILHPPSINKFVYVQQCMVFCLYSTHFAMGIISVRV